MKNLLLSAALAATTVLAGAFPAAADYPTSPVQFIVAVMARSQVRLRCSMAPRMALSLGLS